MVSEAHNRLTACDSFEDFICQSRGPSDLHPNVEHIRHPAATLLQEYRDDGVDFCTSSPLWTKEQVAQALQRGAHQSAKQHLDFVREDFVDMIRKKYWVVLPAADVLELPKLRLSPLGVVPQADRRPRIICDYTFFEVNQHTEHVAPSEAMQFGRALQRVLYRLSRANPVYGPVYMAKYDLSDGFYRIQLRPRAIPSLGVLLPVAEGEDPLVALPMVLPMGWTESPPAFCAGTETAADLSNQKLLEQEQVQPHRLEELADTPPDGETAPTTCTTFHGPMSPRAFDDTPTEYVDVYVDDLLAQIQGDQAARKRVTRVILHSLDEVFRPLEPDDLPERQEPVSSRKLEKGDGYMSTTKTMLGWLVDSRTMTIQLTARRYTRLLEILDSLPATRKRVSVKTWQKVLGELRSMALALPGSRGLFSALQFRFRQDKKRIRLTRTVHDFLDDFRWLANDMRNRPTRIYELFPSEVTYLGATDASGLGMGGVFFVPTPDSTPEAPDYESYLWQQKFPDFVRENLVTRENPKGTITNSDLEMAATVAHNDVVALKFCVAEATLHCVHDNTPAVFWNRKGSTTTDGPAAYLLRIQALHARHHRYLSMHDFIPGHLNRLADEASRRVTLTPDELLTHFDTHYPQVRPWNICTLRSEMNSALISALRRQRSEPASWIHAPGPATATGNCGWSSVPTTPWILGSPKGTILYRTSKFSLQGTALDASHPAEGPFVLAQLLTPFEVSARNTEGWGPQTPDLTATERPISD